MKKFAAFFLNLMLLISLTACGADITPDDDAPVVTPPVSESADAGVSMASSGSGDVGADVSMAPSGSESAGTGVFTAPGGKDTDSGESTEQTGSVVYFTADISPEGLMRVYEALGWTPTGKVAVKLSTGEPPASNYLRPELIGDLVQSVEGTIVECNTAYGGSRAETAMHMQVAEDHGFTAIADVDILDAEGSIQLEVDELRRLSFYGL